MDEATANIDIKTEEVIQSAVHNFLNKSTLITIAHRIKTILAYDKIMVLQNGEVIEFDTPSNLIANKDSLFYDLYSKSSL
jgi:ABC-type multidrug transport system fused ATPase/permease subunit